MEVVLEAGAEDIETEGDGSVSVYTPWESLSDVVGALKSEQLEPDNAEVTMVPSTYSACEPEDAEKVLRLIDALEELEDVQNVYSNGDFPDSVLDA